MTRLSEWLSRYSESHRHPVNRRIHHICVPAIMWSLLAGLWLVPLPLNGLLPFYLNNLSIVVMSAALIFYFILSWRVALLITATVILMLGMNILIQSAGWSLHWIALAVFVLAWVGQFVGHGIEGKRPSFVEDLRFLLIGPIWVFTDWLPALGVDLDE